MSAAYYNECDPEKAEWIRELKLRPIEPGLFPLAHGAPARVLRLRGYGDAICAPPRPGNTL